MLCGSCEHNKVCQWRKPNVDCCLDWSGWYDASIYLPEDDDNEKQYYVFMENKNDGNRLYGTSRFYGCGEKSDCGNEFPNGVWEANGYDYEVIYWKNIYEVEK